jgi:hypothetical protein
MSTSIINMIAHVIPIHFRGDEHKIIDPFISDKSGLVGHLVRIVVDDSDESCLIVNCLQTWSL